MSVLAAEEYLNEAEVLARWPMISRAELRKARKANPPRIAFYDFPRRTGGPRCTAAQVQDYITRTYLKAPPCAESQTPMPNASQSEATILSAPIPPEADHGTPADTTKPLDKSVAEALASEILNKPKSGSRRSSQPRPKAAAKTARLRLVKS